MVEFSHARVNSSEIAQELGIKKGLLYSWIKEFNKYEENSFPRHGRPKLTDLEYEVFHLCKELRDAKMTRCIL